VFTNQLFLDKTSMHYLLSVAATHLDSSLRISVWQGGNHDVTVTALGQTKHGVLFIKNFRGSEILLPFLLL